MKMNFKVFGLIVYSLVLLLNLSSCGEQKPADLSANLTADQKQESKMVEYTGIVSAVDLLDNTANNLSPYLLKIDGKDTFVYLDSDKKLKEFEGKTVKVSGYFQDSSIQLLTVIDIKEVDDSLLVNMKNYFNMVLGIEFYYPVSWTINKISEDKITANISESKKEVITISRFENKKNESYDIWIPKNFKTSQAKDIVIGDVNDANNSYSAKKITLKDSEVVVINFKGYYFHIVFDYVGTDKALVQKDFDQLLNTIKLYEATSVEQNMNVVSEDDMVVSPSENTNSSTNVLNTTNANASTTVKNSTGTKIPMTNATLKVPTTSTATTITSPTKSTTTPTTKPTSSTTTTTTNDLVSYVYSNKSIIPTSNGTPVITQVESAGSKYFYVTYTDGDVSKKALFSYSNNGGEISAVNEGVFQKSIDNKLWNTVSGKNLAANEPRKVYNVSDTGTVTSEKEVATGKNLYTSSTSGFDTQYPKDWFYGTTYNNGVKTVTFSNKPTDENPDQKVEVAVYTKYDTSNADKTTVNGKTVYSIKNADGSTQLVVEGADGKKYVTTSTSDTKSQQALTDIVSSLETK